MIKKSLAALAIAALGAGCASSPSWDVNSTTDPMTGESQAWVVPNETGAKLAMNIAGVQTAFLVSPAFAKKHGEPCAGMASIGDRHIPVGSVQLKVDDGAIYAINPTDGMVPGPDLAQYNRDIVGKLVVPYTITCGERGAAIIAEVKAGHVLKSRQMVGADPAGKTIETPITDGLLKALAEAGL